FDWLSRDAAEVDKYIADPLCGFAASVQLWIDLLDALGDVTSPARQARIPKRLPIYVISGSNDPVGGNTKSVRQLLDAYRTAGLECVTDRFYDGARHELFNETNRDDVTRDLIQWLDGVVARLSRGRRSSNRPSPRAAGRGRGPVAPKERWGG